MTVWPIPIFVIVIVAILVSSDIIDIRIQLTHFPK
jgi:hypothetical protein